MDTVATLTRNENEIRSQLEDWANAVRAKDLTRIFTHYAPDIVAFDAIAQLQFKGAEAYRAHWEACMAMCPGPMTFEVHNVQVFAGEDLAFAHALTRCGGTGPDGTMHCGWMRFSAGYRKQHGKWQVVHEHFSAPFDPLSDKTLWLEP